MIIIGICLGALNVWYTKNKGSDYLDKFDDVEPGIQVANVGSSHGLWGFCYQDIEIEKKCFNFAMESQSLSYDYRVLEQYQDKLAENGVMFVVVSYFSFYGEDETAEPDFEAKNTRYYSILSPKYIKNYTLMNDVTSHYMPVLGAQEGIVERLKKNQDKENQPEEIWKRKASDLNIPENAQAAETRHIENRKDSSGKMIVNQEEIEALYKLIELCELKNIRVVMVTTPYLREYNELVPDDFLNEFHEIVQTVQVDTEVEYYDYSKDERFVDSEDLFMNSDHLNKEGAIKFMDILWLETGMKDGR